MSSAELNRLYSKPDRGFSEAKSILAKLYRKVVADLDLGPYELVLLLEQFLNDPRSGIDQTKEKRTTARGNSVKKLVQEKMSMKAFLDLSLMLKPKSMTVLVRYEWEDGSVTEHELLAADKRGTHREPETDDDH